jgi:sporulation protein YabP
MESNLPEVPHRVTLEGRSKLSVSGVKDVESFDESMIVLVTSRGILQVCGENLHLQLLNLEGGQVAVEGMVDSMVYEEERSGGLLSRLWR